MFASTTSATSCDMVHFSQASGDTTVANMHSSANAGGYDSDANSVIIELALGDWVYVQLRAGDGRIYSDSSRPLNTFSGFLLFQ